MRGGFSRRLSVRRQFDIRHIDLDGKPLDSLPVHIRAQTEISTHRDLIALVQILRGNLREPPPRGATVKV